MNKIVEVIKESRRLELGSVFEIGNYEEDFLTSNSWLWVRCWDKWYKVPFDLLLAALKALPANYGNVGDVVAKICPLSIETKGA